MDTAKIKTLQQVDAALLLVENAMTQKNLSDSDTLTLNTAFVNLRDLERSIINTIGDELVESLKCDSNSLSVLSDQIDKSSAKLGNIATAVKKATQAVDALITVIIAAAAVGLA